MYLLLLVFGAILTAAGIVLAASGVSIHDRAFDASIVTPGMVAAVGGLLLFGLGLALRVLQRIEEAIALRPVPRAARPGEPATPTAAAERPSEAGRIRVPAKPVPRPQTAVPAAAAPSAAPASGSERRLEDLLESHPDAAPEGAGPIKETEPSLSPKSPPAFVPSSVDAAFAVVARARAARQRNGGAPTRITPRLDISARSPTASERPAGPAFDTLWPKSPRPARATPSASAAEPEQNNEPAGAAPQTLAPNDATVSILKSGVVDGMAYTLYSDGSIEAQLPQGTLRFGSITELRNHIEQSA